MNEKNDQIKYEIRMYFLLFMMYSFLGWVYESIWYSINAGHFINRGFNYGPYIPVYGFGAAIIMYIVAHIVGPTVRLGHFNIRPIAIFIAIFVVSTIVELICSYVMEYALGIILWDYSKEFMNYQGRICLRASLNFAVGGTLIYYTIQRYAKYMVDKMSVRSQRIFAAILLCIIVSDFTVSFIITEFYPNIKKEGILDRKV